VIDEYIYEFCDWLDSLEMFFENEFKLSTNWYITYFKIISTKYDSSFAFNDFQNISNGSYFFKAINY